MSKTCLIIGCDKPEFCKGYCRKHYYNFNVHGDPCYKKPEKKCSECNQKHYAKGLCRDCYFKAKGTVGGKTIEGCATCSQGCDASVYGKGLCRKCWNRLKSAGTLHSKTIPDLPDEVWRPIQRPDCQGILVSNMGRIKSIRKRDEVLLNTRMVKGNPKETLMAAFNIHVHMEVLRAFYPNTEGDFQAVFLDGNRSNCRADNLRWYGKEYLVAKAIEMAENSDHPLASSFLKFWHGENNILNDWFEHQKDRLKGFLYRRLDKFCVPYYVDVDDCVQETIVAAFLALRRGMIQSLDNINSWMFEIAKKVLACGVRDLLPGVSMVRTGAEGNEYNIIDYNTGWRHPSAELQAIYNEEVVNI